MLFTSRNFVFSNLRRKIIFVTENGGGEEGLAHPSSVYGPVKDRKVHPN